MTPAQQQYYREYQARYRAGLSEEQREATNAARRAKRAANPKAVKAEGLKRKYGLSLEQFTKMIADQRSSCALCKTTIEPQSAKYSPHSACVDHCHETGKVRALLCGKCNRGIGLFLDSPTALRNAAAYLEEHQP